MITGLVTSFAVSVTVQFAVSPAASVAVIITECVWLCDELSTTPAAGDWVSVKVQLSVAVTAGNKLGTVILQFASRFTFCAGAQVEITGG